jgi:hypothetical protein
MLDEKLMECTLTESTPKSESEPLTLVYRLEFNDRDAERVEALLGPVGLLVK